MTTYEAVYKLAIYAPRSIDLTETTVLLPVAGAPHTDKFLVSTRAGISDALGSYKPYLKVPSLGRRGKVDVRSKTTDTGVMYFDLVDPELPGGDPLARWLPAFLGDLKGQLRAGGLLCRAWESLDGGATWTGFWTGRVRTLQQPKPINYRLGVRELTDGLNALAFVGRPHASITYAGFPTLLPVGAATVAYGTGPGALPAVPPLKGRISTLPVWYPTGRIVSLGAGEPGQKSRTRADNIVTKNLMEACPFGEENLFSQAFAGTARVRLKRLDTQAIGFFYAALTFLSPHARYGVGTRVNINDIGIGELPAGAVGRMDFPPAGTDVEVWIEGDQEPSEAYPLVVGDVHLITLIRHLLDGKFGFLWEAGAPLPAGVAAGDPRLPIPYVEAEIAALEADATFPLVRRIVPKRQKRGEVLQELLRAGNLAYFLDGDGVFHLIDLRTPTDVSSVPTITDADLALAAPKNWEYDRGKAITLVDAFYYSDALVGNGGLVNEMLYDVVIPRGVGQAGFEELRHKGQRIVAGSMDLDDELFVLDIKWFRWMKGEAPLNGVDRAEYYRRYLHRLALETARPFGVGAPTLPLSCKRGSGGDALQGALRKISIRSVPDPATKKLGGTRLVRVVERQEKHGFVTLHVMDLGQPTVAVVPVLGVPAQEVGNTQDGVTVTVTLNAAGDPVEVHYAVTDTSVGAAPAEGSGLWTPIANGLIRVTGDVTFRGLPAGKRIWVRGRSFPDVRVNYVLPSAWAAAAAPGRVDLAALAAPSAPVASLITARSFRLAWTNGSADLMTELLMATPVTDPRVVVARVTPGSSLYDFPGDTALLLQPVTTYRIGVRHTDGPDSVSAEVTVDVTTTGFAPDIRPPFNPPSPYL